MKAEQVDQGLYQKFVTEQQRLIFWHDPQGEFTDYVAAGLAGPLAQVKILYPAQLGGFSSKLLLEKEDPTGQYLIYTQGEKPAPEQDFLLDIRLYSTEFHADIASIWLQDLGLPHLYLREHLQARATFLNNQERRRKLKRLLGSQEDEISLDRKMIAILVSSAEATPFAILRALCHGHLQEEHFPLETPPEMINLLAKMSLLLAFWAMMGTEFSYSSDHPSLADLLRRLFISELLGQLAPSHLPALAHYQLPEAGQRNAKVCLTQWRDSNSTAVSYKATAQAIATELAIGTHLQELPLTALAEVVTFAEVEPLLLSGLKQLVLKDRQTIDLDTLTELAKRRQTSHWLLDASEENPEKYAQFQAYEAIVTAAQLFHYHGQTGDSLQFSSSEALLEAYATSLYQYDYLYRRFCTAARFSYHQGWDLLKTLSAAIEDLYSTASIHPLGREWSRLLDQGFLGRWITPTLPPQQKFYEMTIEPYLNQSERKRAFVIISDAFRYEAAQELVEVLNSKYRLKADLSPLLGVLPSYTALGMASLLPHQTLTYDEKGDVLVDGKASQNTAARHGILTTIQGMACQANELRQMKQEQAREFTEGKRVIYIYHNVIDDRLDGDSNESGSFGAVSDCLRELAELTQLCVNKLNASQVWITADHDFLFQQTFPEATEKSHLSYTPAGTLKTNKRYLIGSYLGSAPEVHAGRIAVTAGAETGLEFWIPRGANRFHFGGGPFCPWGSNAPRDCITADHRYSTTGGPGSKIEGGKSGDPSIGH